MTEAEPEPEPGLFPTPRAEPGPTQDVVERAFQLARGGAYVTIEQIADQLRTERHEAVDARLFDPAIRKALRQACAEARQAAAKARGSGPFG